MPPPIKKAPPKYPKDKLGNVISPVKDIYGEQPSLKKGRPVSNMTGADAFTDTLRATGEAIQRPFQVKNAAQGNKRALQDFQDVYGGTQAAKVARSIGKPPAMGAKGVKAAPKLAAIKATQQQQGKPAMKRPTKKGGRG